MRFAFFTSLQRAYIRSCRTGRDAMHCVSTSVAMPWYVRIATCLIFVTAVETDNYPSLQKNPSRHLLSIASLRKATTSLFGFVIRIC